MWINNTFLKSFLLKSLYSVMIFGYLSVSFEIINAISPGTTTQKVANEITEIANAIKKTVEEKNGVIRIKDYIGDTLASYSKYIPQSIYNALMNTDLKNVTVRQQLSAAERENYGLGSAVIRGTLSVNNSPMNVRLLLFNDPKAANPWMAISLIIDLPNSMQLSTWFKDLKAFDAIKFQKSTFAFSIAQYRDVELDLLIGSTEFNFISSINLSEQTLPDFQNLRQFIEKSSSTKTVPFLQVQTVIPLNPLDIKFNVIVPFNLQKNYAQGSIVTKIAADSLIVGISPKNVSLAVSMGMFMYLSTQSEPLRFRLGGTISKTELELYGLMDGMYDPAFGLDWLALGNFGVELDFNFALMSAGIPISGMGFRGIMAFGEGAQQVKVDVATKFQISSDKLPQIGLQAKINQIDLGALFSVFKKKAGKTVTTGDTPTIKFTDLDLKVMPTGMKIAEQEYSKGIEAEGYMDVLGLKGYAYVFLSPGTLTCTIKGALAKIENTYFKMSGPGLPGVAGMTEGPSVALDMSLLNAPPRLPTLKMGAEIEIKPIKWNAKAEFIASLTQIYTKAETTIGQGFGAMFEINIPFTDMKNFGIIFSMKLDFMNALKQKMQEYAKNKKIEIEKDYQELDKKVKDFQAKLDNKKQEEARDLKQKLAEQTKSYVEKLQKAQLNIKSKLDKLIIAQREVQKDKMACKSGQIGKCFEIIGSGLKMVAANAAYEFALLKKDMIDTIAAIKEVAVKVEADLHQKFLQAINDIITELDIANQIRQARLIELDIEVKIVDAFTAFSIKQFSIKVLGSDIAKGKIATGILDWEINFAGKKKAGRWEGAIDFAKPLDYAKSFFNQIGRAITGK